ncbi:MAG: metallophosphatase domain-containing protein [Saprospiraceae bacterium]
MKIVAISDTHGLHNQLQLPKGDMLLHSGDVAKRGSEQEIVAFLNWFSQQDFQYKIFIAGNHDFYFEETSAAAIADLIPENVIYLNDSGVTIEGIHIWGSPVQPRFFDWAFNRDRGADIDRHWQLIPENTDILLTHGPPQGILDKTSQGLEVGCEMLLTRIEQIQPKYNIFGHIHEAYGQVTKNNIHFINASVVNLRYMVVNPPVEFEY